MKSRAQKMIVFVLSSSMMLNGCYWGWGRGRGGGGHHRWSSNAFDGDPNAPRGPVSPVALPGSFGQGAPAAAAKPASRLG